ncbi:MAG: ATP-binding protein [Chloroflexi bacterium]|nr:ATP-binding protein [Chloroflexota bacterium]
MPFLDRTRELDSLCAAATSNRTELIIVYGRRGVGKSTLLAETLRDVRHIFYSATRRALPLQLADLTAIVREAYPDAFVPESFRSIEEFLRFLADLAGRYPDEPVIAVLDELPYLAELDQGLLTVLQHWWDRNKRLPNLKLFLAGSYVAFMERQVLGLSAPLYNRRTGQLKLEPLRYDEAALFFPSYPPRRRIEAYAVLGGMPTYLEWFDPDQGLEENLLATVLRPNTFLNREPDWLLLEDLRRDVTYGSILRAVAAGDRKPSDIARSIGKTSAQDIAQQIEALRDLDLLRREVPITDRQRPASRRSLYWLADNYLAFWYRYVDPNQSLIAEGHGRRVLDRIRASFHEYVARPPFEEVCRQFLRRAYAADRLPPSLHFNAVGTWWNRSHEIDVVAQEGSTTTLAGSCKWTNAPMDAGDLHRLRQTVTAAAADLHPAPDCYHALFSRQGFDASLLAAARRPDSRLLLFTPDDLFA